MKRNPHPARRSRIAALGVSTTAFVSIVTSFAWNTHQAELSTNTGDIGVVPVEQTTQTTPTSPSGTTSPVTPAATIAPTAPTVAPATPVVPTAPATPEVAPASPAPTVVYTCMSPGGKTENPTASGSCKNAKYGYVLTQI